MSVTSTLLCSYNLVSFGQLVFLHRPQCSINIAIVLYFEYLREISGNIKKTTAFILFQYHFDLFLQYFNYTEYLSNSFIPWKRILIES